MIQAYMIPVDGRTTQDYFDYVTSLPIVFDGDDRSIKADGYGYVEVNGSITGLTPVPVKGEA